MGLGFLHSFLVTLFCALPPPQTKNMSDSHLLKPRRPLQFMEGVLSADWCIQMPKSLYKKLHIFIASAVSWQTWWGFSRGWGQLLMAAKSKMTRAGAWPLRQREDILSAGFFFFIFARVCVCVCVCVGTERMRESRESGRDWWREKKASLSKGAPLPVDLVEAYKIIWRQTASRGTSPPLFCLYHFQVLPRANKTRNQWTNKLPNPHSQKPAQHKRERSRWPIWFAATSQRPDFWCVVFLYMCKLFFPFSCFKNSVIFLRFLCWEPLVSFQISCCSIRLMPWSCYGFWFLLTQAPLFKMVFPPLRCFACTPSLPPPLPHAHKLILNTDKVAVLVPATQGNVHRVYLHKILLGAAKVERSQLFKVTGLVRSRSLHSGLSASKVQSPPNKPRASQILGLEYV